MICDEDNREREREKECEEMTVSAKLTSTGSIMLGLIQEIGVQLCPVMESRRTKAFPSSQAPP
jgi:hypothetical protein